MALAGIRADLGNRLDLDVDECPLTISALNDFSTHVSAMGGFNIEPLNRGNDLGATDLTREGGRGHQYGGTQTTRDRNRGSKKTTHLE